MRNYGDPVHFIQRKQRQKVNTQLFIPLRCFCYSEKFIPPILFCGGYATETITSLTINVVDLFVTWFIH